MSPTGWILFVIVGFVTALNPVPHRTNEESLRGALNALTRKQRSLDYNTREFYNNLPSFKYRGDNDRKFERQREDNDFDEDEEELEFLPLENGQIEPINDEYRNLNEKLLEKALADYAKSESAQEEAVPSLFRERERTANIKRGIRNERPNPDDELARLFLDELEYGPYSQDEIDDNEYNTLRMLHRPQQDNQYYGDGLISWGDVLEKKPLRERFRDESDVVEFPERESDLYLMPMERRNVNARFPIGRDFRNYREMSKRFPLAVAKRSAKAVSQMKQITDPKVAHDLGILFGTQSTENKNHTHEHDGNHDHNQEKNKAHQHGSDVHGMTAQNQEITSIAPNVNNSHQMENNTKINQSKERPIEVKKKSVNWSDYFGIDKRKKKSTFMPKPGSQNQDDEWFLERYYKTMAENLKSENDKDERKDKLQQMESRLKHIKDLIIQEALNVEGTDIEEIREKVLSRLAAAYSLDKMRKALNEFRDAVAQRESQKLSQDHQDDTLTTSPPENNGISHEKIDEKRRTIISENEEGFDEGNTCPELEAIDIHCRMTGLMSHDLRNILHDSCVSTLICRSCGGQDCLNKFAFEVEKACESLEIQQSIWSKEQCLGAARLLPINPPATLVALCHSDGRDSCLIRNYYHNRQRNINHRFGYDNVISMQR
ncbi:midasin isoform X2 [Leptopilina boulardi]|uniref:midasin isoform X2 n=1 Tax=Leptopilina boulardi TaxID=63433 RepID=UPI0021F60D14|nr:midasin isoform X2 [Leptopilina boulardi]